MSSAGHHAPGVGLVQAFPEVALLRFLKTEPSDTSESSGFSHPGPELQLWQGRPMPSAWGGLTEVKRAVRKGTLARSHTLP